MASTVACDRARPSTPTEAQPQPPPPATAAASSAPRPTPSSSAQPPLREATVRGIRFVEVFRHGATEASPLVVAIHGRGGSPEDIGGLLAGVPDAIEVALPQAPTPYRGGWSWFDWPTPMDEQRLADGVSAAETALWPAIAEVAHGRRIMVTGFSQGGVLSFVVAARHAADVAYAFPISGGAPRSLWPHEHQPSAPVYALHGTDDPVVPLMFARATVAAFRANGGVAELREFAGVHHEVTPEMRADVLAHVEDALKDGARTAP
jgi:phospholipase/carboxylesterase